MISLCAVNEIRTGDQRSDRMRFLNNFLRFRLISGLYFVKKILYGHKNYRDLFGENHLVAWNKHQIHIFRCNPFVFSFLVIAGILQKYGMPPPGLLL